jgi:hypothetical protein
MAETPADVLVAGETSIDAATEDFARPPPAGWRRLTSVWATSGAGIGAATGRGPAVV